MLGSVPPARAVVGLRYLLSGLINPYFATHPLRYPKGGTRVADRLLHTPFHVLSDDKALVSRRSAGFVPEAGIRLALASRDEDAHWLDVRIDIGYVVWISLIFLTHLYILLTLRGSAGLLTVLFSRTRLISCVERSSY